MEMTRPPAGSSETSAFSNVVLPEPVPPEIGRFRSRRTMAAASSATAAGSKPLAVSSSTIKVRPPKRRMVKAAAHGGGDGRHASADQPPRRERDADRQRAPPEEPVLGQCLARDEGRASDPEPGEQGETEVAVEDGLLPRRTGACRAPSRRSPRP